MDEEQIKRKLLEQLSGDASAQVQSSFQQAQMDAALKGVMLNLLDEKARERMNNIRVVRPEIYSNLIAYLAQLYQAGQIRGKITEEQIVAVLNSMSQRKETKIKRK